LLSKRLLHRGVVKLLLRHVLLELLLDLP
jgi:hypothetical protein